MTIPTTDWYVIANTWKQARIGQSEVVVDLGDLQQAIEIILKTYPGESALRPIGSRLRDHIDLPVDVARPLIIRDVADAIALWEPRVELTSLIVDINATSGSIMLTIYWQVKGSKTIGQLVLDAATLIKG